MQMNTHIDTKIEWKKFPDMDNKWTIDIQWNNEYVSYMIY